MTSDLEPENYETSNEDSSGIQLELIDEEDEEGKIDEWKEAQAKHFINTDAQDYAEPIEQQLPVKYFLTIHFKIQTTHFSIKTMKWNMKQRDRLSTHTR